MEVWSQGGEPPLCGPISPPKTRAVVLCSRTVLLMAAAMAPFS
jgi:hypothetical protein